MESRTNVIVAMMASLSYTLVFSRGVRCRLVFVIGYMSGNQFCEHTDHIRQVIIVFAEVKFGIFAYERSEHFLACGKFIPSDIV